MSEPNAEYGRLVEVIHDARMEAHRRHLSGDGGFYDRFVADAVETYLALWIGFDHAQIETDRRARMADPEYVRYQAITLALARGCNDSNPCWSDCVETAEDQISEGRLDDWDQAQIDRSGAES